MGEARRKKDAVYHPKVPQLRQYTIEIRRGSDDSDDAKLRTEHEHMQKKYPGLTLTGYIAALVNAAVEQERMQREAEEQRGRIVQSATPADVAKAAGASLDPSRAYVGRRSR